MICIKETKVVYQTLTIVDFKCYRKIQNGIIKTYVPPTKNNFGICNQVPEQFNFNNNFFRKRFKRKIRSKYKKGYIIILSAQLFVRVT